MDVSSAVTGSSAIKAAAAAAHFYPTFSMAALMDYSFTHCPQSHCQKLSLFFFLEVTHGFRNEGKNVRCGNAVDAFFWL